MRVRLLVLLMLAALSAAPRAAAQEGAARPGAYGADAAPWARYTYPGDEFSAEMPGMPFLMHTERAVGRLPVRREKMRVFGRYSGGVVYFVAAYDRPQTSESHEQFAAYLRGAWTLTPKGGATLGGFEGKSYEVTGKPGGRINNELHGEARVFRTKKHAYLALALSLEPGRPEVARFLDSLTLGPSPAGERIAEPAPASPVPEPAAAAPGGATGRGGGVGEGEGGGTGPARPEAGAPARDTNARRAVIVYKPEPGYTEEGRKSMTSGFVRLRVALGADGEVKDVSVIKGLPDGLTDRAVRAARYMLFFPALKDGRPASQYVVLEYNFNIY
ncbi:MAG TPA: energy transducer TonB [Pyrinomonadaceae bacterium]|jgi:TonB family protein